MIRRILLHNTDTGEELVMPVTPASFDIEETRQVETLDMAGEGQINLPGIKGLFDVPQEFLLPSAPRSYATDWQDPYQIVDRLRRWMYDGDVVRYIVSDTPVNVPCLIQSVRYREQDGTNDVYLTLTLRQYRFIESETLTAPPGAEGTAAASATEDAAADSAETTYVVQSGDSLWAICYSHYGDGQLCYRLATYNHIGNSYLIHPGDKLLLPPRATLELTAATYPPTAPRAAPAAETAYKAALLQQVEPAARSLRNYGSYQGYVTSNLSAGQPTEAQRILEGCWGRMSAQQQQLMLGAMERTDPAFAAAWGASHA